MVSDKRTKMAIISGASHALAYKARNIRATDDEVIQHINREMEKITKKIDSGELDSEFEEI